MTSQETSPTPSGVPLTARTFNYKGVTYRGAATPIENLKAMETFTMRDDDIAIVTYPKSGTHLVYEILYWVLHGKTRPADEYGFIAGLEFTLPGPNGQPDVRHEKLASTPTSSPRTMFTHLQRRMAPPGLAQPDKNVKVIVVMRNPKDVAVSYYNYERNDPCTQSKKSWDEFYREFQDGKAVHGSYYDHVLGWWDMRDDPHFLFLTYEDMNRDLTSAVKSISSFLKKDLNNDTVSSVVEACSFQTMKERYSKSALPFRPFLTRKGKIGDWRNYFTPEQNREFDAEYEARMAGTGLSFDFE